jgi:cell division protein FtsB
MMLFQEQSFVLGGDGSLFNSGRSLQRKRMDAVKKLILCHFQVLAISYVFSLQQV